MNSPGGSEQIEKSEEEKGKEGRKFCPSECNVSLRCWGDGEVRMREDCWGTA